MELENDAKDTGSVSGGESSSDSQATKDTDTTKTQVDEKSTVVKDLSNGTPFHEHPRFKELVDEKNQSNMRVEMLSKEVETR